MLISLFTDLPAELIHDIFLSLNLKDARSLACSCRYLHAIGQQYTFKHRDLCINWRGGTRKPRSCHHIIVPDPLSDVEGYPSAKHALDIRNIFLEYAKFLLSRPDIVEQIETLGVSDLIPCKAWGYELKVHEEAWKKSFYKPVWDIVQNLLTEARNISVLTFFQIELSKNVLKCFRHLRRLHTLRLDYYFFTGGTIRSMCKGKPKPPTISSSVLNLDLRVPVHDDALHEDCWRVIQFFSNIRTLSIACHPRDPMEAPPEKLIEKGALFSTLEKLAITNASEEVIFGVADWIGISAIQRGLNIRLTHLSISTVYDIDMWADWVVHELFVALQCTPIEVLALEGLNVSQLYPHIFDRIAASCPNLRGLTLIARNFERSGATSTTADWMHASWKYALPFSGFQRLEYFCWNFRVALDDISPSSMIFFEEQFTQVTSKETPIESDFFVSPSPIVFFEEGFPQSDKEESTNESDIFDDSHWTAYPFAAYCPSLRGFSMLIDPTEAYYCEISRSDSGAISLTPSKERLDGPKLEQWNVVADELMPHWPRSFPLDTRSMHC